jgi:AraC-like DNA-binding protein
VANECEVTARFCTPSPILRPYFTTFYEIRIRVHHPATIVDYLHPEWANMRFVRGDLPLGELPGRPALGGAAFVASGPTSRAIRFTVGSTRMWGIGLLPLGWARFVGTPAADEADTLVDGCEHPAFADFRPLARTLFAVDDDPEAELARIEAHFLARLNGPVSDETRILAIHEALIDPEVHGVGDLADRAGVAQRTLERLCCRHFGFAPKLLLRRQRFMRSLSHFLLEPQLKWIEALDDHYHDQAQFVRDFRRFMGMSPRQYAALPHPILESVVQQRLQFGATPVQALHPPGR